jgi:UDP-N-acetylmuramoylalanine--D-glutamate ligase
MTAATRPPAAPEPLGAVRRALVVGLGASGRAAARVLADAGVEVVVVEERSDHPAAAGITGAQVTVLLGRPAVEALDAATDLVVPSPGVPEGAPVLRAAAARGVPVWSEPELGLRLHPRPLVAVTGTNGKTSTTELLAAMLAADGRDVRTCGNIGTPVCEAAADAPPETVLVAELSSFQLRFAGHLRPAWACCSTSHRTISTGTPTWRPTVRPRPGCGRRSSPGLGGRQRRRPRHDHAA